MAEPLLITRIEDRNGNILANFSPKKHEVISQNTAATMVRMMEGVVNYGTGARIRTRFNIQSELGGKTGTTNSNTDGWFIGYSPQLLAGAWVGFNYNFLHFSTTHIGQGANTGLPIFALFMKKVYADKTLDIKPGAQFDLPPVPVVTNPYNFDPNVPPGQTMPGTGGNGNANDYFDVDNKSGDKKAASESGKTDNKSRQQKPKALYPPQGDGH
jgi:penicillin-binding protein 1A